MEFEVLDQSGKLLLELASTAILGSESSGTHENIVAYMWLHG
jgi:hypothetical protein